MFGMSGYLLHCVTLISLNYVADSCACEKFMRKEDVLVWANIGDVETMVFEDKTHSGLLCLSECKQTECKGIVFPTR